VNSAGSVVGSERLRLFCGFPLPDDTGDGLFAWQHDVFGPTGVRVVSRAHLHVTLAFLGHRPAAEREAISGALRDAVGGAGVPRFRVARYRETRSVGMLVLDDDEGRGAAIAVALHERLERLGVYEPERRPWLAHVTVARFHRRPGLQPSLPGLPPFGPSEAALYHSVLRSTGAQYEILDTVALGMRR
jgi:2'-5' RNA ligase